MGKPEEPTPNLRLKREREIRGWSQEVLAEKIGASPFSVSQWELGRKTPGPHNRKMLCELFGKNAVELGFVEDQSEDAGEQCSSRSLHEQEQPFPPIWNVPYEQNPSFTGRENILQQLHTSLIAGKATALTQTLSGLGGIGKTQIAVEYCYRFRHEYKAVMWAKASSREELISDIISIVKLLRVPVSGIREQQPIINAFRQWMKEQAYWLLVIDNVESIEIIRDILPPARRGHILLTARTQATGTFPKINVPDMPSDEGALLLLHRVSVLPCDANLNKATEPDGEMARQISHTLGGLPLALDQAGAYIQETGCGLSDYLEQYKVRRAELLKYRSELSVDYPLSVATTWSLSFERIEKANAAAAALLCACAFLHPENIPEEVFTRGAGGLGPAFQPLIEDAAAIDQIIGEILKYSLIRRNTKDKTLSVHRLVQAVLVDNMDKETQRMWAERIVKAVNQVLVLDEAIADQAEQRYLLQTQACTKLIDEWDLPFLEAVQLISGAGKYMRGSGYYAQAEQHCLRALDMFHRIPEASTVDTCRCLTILMLIKADLGSFVEAETLCERLLALCEEMLGPAHPYTAFSLYYLANLYMKRGKFERAEPLVTRALTICKSASLSRVYPVSDTLMSLAKLYSNQNKVTQAETLYLEALMTAEQTFGSEHLKVASILTEMAIHYSSHGELKKAEQLRKRSLEIYKRVLPPDHPDIAIALTGLSVMYFSQKRYTESEEYYEQAIKIWERKFRTVFANPEDGATLPSGISNDTGDSSQKWGDFQHLLFSQDIMGLEQAKEVVTTSIRLASSFLEQGKYSEAEALFWNALHISEKTLGKEDLMTVYCLGDLATFYQMQKQYVFAEFLYERALQISGVKYRMVPLGTKQIAENYIQFLRETGREHFADELKRYFDELKKL